jgi:antitoxin (DNA-binding transcriptional repressor) of toxin-antitoxin stability system
MEELVVERIAHRELRNNSAEILRRVAAGESFEITNHREVVAILRPPEEALPPLDIVKPATRKGKWSDLPRVKGNGRPTSEILEELREERL